MEHLQEFGFLVFITLVYGFLYSQMSQSEFGFKDPIDPLYFSFTTMSTVGYGDISPKTRRAKMLVMTQQMFLMFGEIALFLKYFRK